MFVKSDLFGIVLTMLCVALTLSCGNSKNKAMDTIPFRVNSLRVPCEGVAPMECLEIRRGDSDTWELFYSKIEGFEYEEGYLYRIRVREEKLDPSQVPADASSIRYTLVAVEEKVRDPKLLLNDIWVLQELEGRQVGEEMLDGQLQRPHIEFHLRDRRFMGTDGCNTFRGSIVSIEDGEFQMGPVMSTRMLCRDMNLPEAFLKSLSRVDSFTLKEGYLALLEGDTELLIFRKSD